MLGRQEGRLPAPWVSDWVALYYNTEHFVEAELDPKRPPKTIDEFAEDARS